MAVALHSIKTYPIDNNQNQGLQNKGYTDDEAKLTKIVTTVGNNNGSARYGNDVSSTDHPEQSASVDVHDSREPRAGCCARGVGKVQKRIVDWMLKYKVWIQRAFLLILFLLYMAYFIAALIYHFGDEASIRLLVFTIFGILLVIWHFTAGYISPFFQHLTKLWQGRSKRKTRLVIRWALYLVSTIVMVTLLIVLVAVKNPQNLISLAGLAAFILLSYITSHDPARVNWHPVFWGFTIQYFFAVIILKTRWGYDTFDWLGDRVTEFLDYTSAGAAFVFGDGYREHYFAFAILPVIVFFSSAISVLYYLGVMQAVVQVLGRFLALCLNTTPAESINAAGNIFVGQTEAPLMIRPFIPTMTKSEIHAVMTGGFATIAGSVLGAYIGFGVPADHLLAASVMSAPAALAISKLSYPETETPQVSEDDYKKMESITEQNIIEAASSGASAAIPLVANVAVNVMAFLSILAFINSTLKWFGERIGTSQISFEWICSYLLYPVAIFMGTEPNDCRRVAELVGVKTFTNEFIAYSNLKVLLDNRKTYTNYSHTFDVNDPANIRHDGDDMILTHWNITLVKGIISVRSEIIATYALCGFSNFGSMGIMLGGLSAMAPERRKDMAAIVFRAMIAGNVACFFTACIAGLFFQEFT